MSEIGRSMSLSKSGLAPISEVGEEGTGGSSASNRNSRAGSVEDGGSILPTSQPAPRGSALKGLAGALRKAAAAPVDLPSVPEQEQPLTQTAPSGAPISPDDEIVNFDVVSGGGSTGQPEKRYSIHVKHSRLAKLSMGKLKKNLSASVGVEPSAMILTVTDDATFELEDEWTAGDMAVHSGTVLNLSFRSGSSTAAAIVAAGTVEVAVSGVSNAGSSTLAELGLPGPPPPPPSAKKREAGRGGAAPALPSPSPVPAPMPAPAPMPVPVPTHGHLSLSFGQASPSDGHAVSGGRRVEGRRRSSAIAADAAAAAAAAAASISAPLAIPPALGKRMRLRRLFASLCLADDSSMGGGGAFLGLGGAGSPTAGPMSPTLSASPEEKSSGSMTGASALVSRAELAAALSADPDCSSWPEYDGLVRRLLTVEGEEEAGGGQGNGSGWAVDALSWEEASGMLQSLLDGEAQSSVPRYTDEPAPPPPSASAPTPTLALPEGATPPSSSHGAQDGAAREGARGPVPVPASAARYGPALTPSVREVVLEVEVGGAGVVDLPIRVGDDPGALAEDFVARHGLPRGDAASLAALITPRLAQAYQLELADAVRAVREALAALAQANERLERGEMGEAPTEAAPIPASVPAQEAAAWETEREAHEAALSHALGKALECAQASEAATRGQAEAERLAAEVSSQSAAAVAAAVSAALETAHASARRQREEALEESKRMWMAELEATAEVAAAAQADAERARTELSTRLAEAEAVLGEHVSAAAANAAAAAAEASASAANAAALAKALQEETVSACEDATSRAQAHCARMEAALEAAAARIAETEASLASVSAERNAAVEQLARNALGMERFKAEAAEAMKRKSAWERYVENNYDPVQADRGPSDATSAGKAQDEEEGGVGGGAPLSASGLGMSSSMAGPDASAPRRASSALAAAMQAGTWREWAAEKREILARANADRAALIEENKRLRGALSSGGMDAESRARAADEATARLAGQVTALGSAHERAEQELTAVYRQWEEDGRRWAGERKRMGEQMDAIAQAIGPEAMYAIASADPTGTLSSLLSV